MNAPKKGGSTRGRKKPVSCVIIIIIIIIFAFWPACLLTISHHQIEGEDENEVDEEPEEPAKPTAPSEEVESRSTRGRKRTQSEVEDLIAEPEPPKAAAGGKKGAKRSKLEADLQEISPAEEPVSKVAPVQVEAPTKAPENAPTPIQLPEGILTREEEGMTVENYIKHVDSSLFSFSFSFFKTDRNFVVNLQHQVKFFKDYQDQTQLLLNKYSQEAAAVRQKLQLLGA